MNETLYQKAQTLANRDYLTEIYKDKTTDGCDLYLAKCPELYGCMVQGKTIEEVLENIVRSREDYIYFLLEDKLPVPEPSNRQTEQANGTITRVIHAMDEKPEWGFKTIRNLDFESILEKVSEPSTRELLYATSSET